MHCILLLCHHRNIYYNSHIRKVSSTKHSIGMDCRDGCTSAVGINKCFLLSFFFTSIVSDRNNKKMPLGDDCHAWKKKTTDVKDQYDFKEVLGT